MVLKKGLRTLAQVQSTVALVTRLFMLVGMAVVAVGTVLAAWLVHHHLQSHSGHRNLPTRSRRAIYPSVSPKKTPVPEVGLLASSINVMLAQIEHAFADKERSERHMRQFVSDASHELRTPLATVLDTRGSIGSGAYQTNR